MKKNGETFSKALLVFVAIAVVLAGMYFVFAANTVVPTRGGASFGFNQNIGNNYSITINNSERNISAVYITLPSSFTFIAGSNYTSLALGANFTTSTVGTSTILNWTNSSGSGGRVLMEVGYVNATFSFNATATVPGTYNITITLMNATGINGTTNIQVQINDTTVPTNITIVTPNRAYTNVSSLGITVGASDNESNIGKITIIVSNVTFSQTNASALINNASSYTFSNAFTGLPDGIYIISATVNDTAGNRNSSISRNITLDATAPNITFTTSSTTESNFTSVVVFWVNITANDATSGLANITIQIFNSTGLVNRTVNNSLNANIKNLTFNVSRILASFPDGIYYINATATDEAGNRNTTVTKI
ncbi:MAG: Ig-like domain-containing protein, partial [archaeon]|nr:Ig-like domain-containing protein [archaeon]